MPDLTRSLPTYLRERALWTRFGDIPVLLAHPEPDGSTPAPIMLWMHGRTATKELDPGRYLRWLRAGIGVCAIDLPGHGERFDRDLQEADRTLEIILGMVDEIDTIVAGVKDSGRFDLERMGIGGMSAGGMATIKRLTRDHPFRCACLEATTGAWMFQRERTMFEHLPEDRLAAVDPANDMEQWREIPVQAIHSRLDEWVAYAGQYKFIDMLRTRSKDADHIEFITYDETGAPFEHAGFGRQAADAKERQTAFLARWLTDTKP